MNRRLQRLKAERDLRSLSRPWPPCACWTPLEDVYMKTVSTLNLSCAHSVDDVEWILGAIRSGLLRMPADGALAGPCRNQK